MPHTPLRPFALCLLGFALVTTACARDKGTDGVKVSFGNDSARTTELGEGDVQITSTDGAVIMAVVGDTVRIQLSDSLRQQTAREIEAGSAKDGGLGAAITRGVSGVVSSAMGFVVRVPVENVTNLRYENGHLRFDTRGGNVKVNTTSSGNSSDKAEFSEDDARRFIEAVEARQAAKRGAMQPAQ